jgi:hypothetical protein
MTTVEAIKRAIADLTEDERRALRSWYEQFDAEQWDTQIEQDIADGRLDSLADEAIRAFQRSQATEL